MWKKIGLVLVVFVAVALTVVATRPDTFHVERGAALSAPAVVAFDQINDFHNWGGWSPWEKLDPNMKKTYEGPAAGAGAIYSWTGNDKVGEGRMTITESKPGEKIAIKLEFFKPFAQTSTTVFTFAPQGGGTQVTWAMDGNNNFVAKAMSMFMNMDKMIGGDFERGLAQLKVQSEAEAQKRAAAEAAAQAAAAEAAARAAAAAQVAQAAEAQAGAPAAVEPAAGTGAAQ
jgi:hypothetical protein